MESWQRNVLAMNPQTRDTSGITQSMAVQMEALRSERVRIIWTIGVLVVAVALAGFRAVRYGTEPDRQLMLMALPIGGGEPLSSLRDEVVATNVLERIKIRILGVPIFLKAYLNVMGVLEAGGYRDENLGLDSRDGEQRRAASGKDVRPVVTLPLLAVRARQLLWCPPFSRNSPQPTRDVWIEEDGAVRSPARASQVGSVAEGDRRPSIDGNLLQ